MSNISSSAAPVDLAALKASLDPTSVETLSLQLPSSVVWFFVASLAVVGNVLLFAAILKEKKMRSNFYLCLMQLAMVDTLFCLSHVIVALKRLTLHANGKPETTSPLTCFWQLYIIWLSQAGVWGVSFVIAFDRFIGAVVPTRYVQLKAKHLQPAYVLIWLAPCAYGSYLTSLINPAPLIANCATGQIMQPAAVTMFANMGIVLNVAAIGFYVTLLVVLAGRLLMALKYGEDLQALKKSLEFHVVLTALMIIAINTFLSLSVPLIYNVVTAGFSATIKAEINPYADVFGLTASLFSFVVTVGRSKDMRIAVGRLLTVAPASSASMNRVGAVMLDKRAAPIGLPAVAS